MQEDVKRYSVVIQESASEMLIQHARFLSQFSEPAARRFVREFEVKSRSLEAMPERCPWLYDPWLPENKYRKLIFEKHYMIAFQIAGDKVLVDAIINCRQDYIWLL